MQHRDQRLLEHPPSSHFEESILADMDASSESHNLWAHQEELGFLSTKARVHVEWNHSHTIQG